MEEGGVVGGQGVAPRARVQVGRLWAADDLAPRLVLHENDDEHAQPAGRVLLEAGVGYLAVEGDGWPYVVPINFAYDGSAVYFHGGSLKASLLEAGPRVCLGVTTVPSRTKARPHLVAP